MIRTQRAFVTTVRVFVLIGYLLMVLLPFYWLFITSLKPRLDILTTKIQYWPKHFTLDNYRVLWSSSNFDVFLKNSVLVSLGTGLFTTCFAILGGYALARYTFKGKSMAVYGLLLTQMIPGVMVMIPTVILFSKIGLMNSLGGLVMIYIVGNIPFCLILMRSFFDRIPVDLEEAALIDGCSKMGSLFRVVLPIMLPGIVATFVFAFIGAWNELLCAIMFISSDESKTIPVGLSMFVQNYDVNWGVMTAGAVMALIPSLIMFAIVQRFVVEGLTDGAVKG
ncbi:sugar ABC transporter permease [Paenibacillus baekrokdamisoli]|uniref:Sugar ABC transporter permease n=1 Tax=Paenibacillus baekrokdamisoli TaxID=1712516 RepID=A0A3G9J791_9BACL|nr:carbohydrate ABC transporter permease [Paenibacillus baekrokdamisoli]MBB3069187.1 multiple sugar transport system permease protein [Paenibacillus baekrokdamisoli]BBH18839.1 sugar ABC transporter permease [Paenibacillus baekrokdamisoli]